MELVICLFVLSLVLFVVGVILIRKDGLGSVTGYIYSVLGVIFLGVTTFVIAPGEIHNGLPARSISTGEYKVAFIYVAGENVNLGIEKMFGDGEDGIEHLYLYQFPKSAFDSESVNIQARKLVVVESGKFRKLVLE